MRLYDVFPTDAQLPTIDASSSEAVKISCTLNYNFFLIGDEIDGQ